VASLAPGTPWPCGRTPREALHPRPRRDRGRRTWAACWWRSPSGDPPFRLRDRGARRAGGGGLHLAASGAPGAGDGEPRRGARRPCPHRAPIPDGLVEPHAWGGSSDRVLEGRVRKRNLRRNHHRSSSTYANPAGPGCHELPAFQSMAPERWPSRLPDPPRQSDAFMRARSRSARQRQRCVVRCVKPVGDGATGSATEPCHSRIRAPRSARLSFST
jgi:hypothetical protein